MVQNALTVTQINQYIQNLLEHDDILNSVCVRGEISNLKLHPATGHYYFSLKDQEGVLKCVMFRFAAAKLRFRPENGMRVLAFGKITAYNRDGAYQLYCNSLLQDGVGDLHQAFEELKQKLGGEGLFDPAHKKPLPQFPGTIAIITAASGAAVHDMLRILRKRYPLTRVRLLSVRVQGAQAAAEIAGAVRYVNKWHLADLIIVGRGGGSLEDLWCFNDERLARVIYSSEIPVISAVGHEPDVTISDYVADLRAATPSNAAELAVPDQAALRDRLEAMQSAMAAALTRQIRAGQRQLKVLASARPLRSPTAYLDERRLLLDRLQMQLSGAQSRRVAAMRQRMIRLAAGLDAMSPLKVLTRGYAMAQTEDGTLLRSVSQLKQGDPFVLSLMDGKIESTVDQICPAQLSGGNYEREE